MSDLTPGSDAYNLLIMYENKRRQRCRQRMLELVRNGIHLFHSDEHQEQVSRFQKVMVDAGDHLFQSDEHRAQVSQFQSANQRAIASVGEHSFQNIEVRRAAKHCKEHSENLIWHTHYCELLGWKAEKEKVSVFV